MRSKNDSGRGFPPSPSYGQEVTQNSTRKYKADVSSGFQFYFSNLENLETIFQTTRTAGANRVFLLTGTDNGFINLNVKYDKLIFFNNYCVVEGRKNNRTSLNYE